MVKLMKIHLEAAPNWSEVDRIRFVYISVICGLVMAMDEKKVIPVTYIKLVMDLEKVRTYPWGLLAFDHLVKSIGKARSKLRNTTSYILDGFSYALQIWVMEAIPVIGELLGEKIDKKYFARCSYWKGSAKVSYDELIVIEKSIGTKCLHVYTSYSVFTYGKVDNLNALVRSGYNFGDHIWESVDDVLDENADDVVVSEDENVNTQLSDEDNELSGLQSTEKQTDKVEVAGLKKRKKKDGDVGTEARKRSLLCQCASTANCTFDEEMKSFVKGVTESSFTAFTESFEKRFKKMEEDVSEIKELICGARRAPTMPPPNPPEVEPKSTVETLLFDDMGTSPFEIDLNLDSQELGQLSQKTTVPGFDPSQCFLSGDIDKQPKKEVDASVDKKKIIIRNAGKDSIDPLLTFVSDELWDAYEAWSFRCLRFEVLKLGPTSLNHKLFDRIIMNNYWLQNDEIDAMMYIFREHTSLGRLPSSRVGFMNCMFSMLIKTEHAKYLKDRRSHKWSIDLLDYANGELPSHGKTRK
ncbi:hypothetical protein CARUB_v10028032mg [Capsella rubella]|uniref:DUF1985 domain-containing protein n=1 Tax=Capsella rubella TaxID=81985 RepID=R0GDF2_9BRAS|nr:hypothetical protein CARUB_v10028032mg [Capsella rubella]